MLLLKLYFFGIFRNGLNYRIEMGQNKNFFLKSLFLVIGQSLHCFQLLFNKFQVLDIEHFYITLLVELDTPQKELIQQFKLFYRHNEVRVSGKNVQWIISFPEISSCLEKDRSRQLCAPRAGSFVTVSSLYSLTLDLLFFQGHHFLLAVRREAI